MNKAVNVKGPPQATHRQENGDSQKTHRKVLILVRNQETKQVTIFYPSDWQKQKCLMTSGIGEAKEKLTFSNTARRRSN